MPTLDEVVDRARNIADVTWWDSLPPAVWAPIIWNESRLNPSALNCTLPENERKGLNLNCRSGPLPAGTVPELSVGLFQKNVRAHYTAEEWEALTADEVQALVDFYKNPINAINERLPVLQSVWDSIKPWAQNEPPETWAALVAVRGQLGGSVAYPLTSDWAKHYQQVVTDLYRQLTGAATGAAAAAGITNIPSIAAGAASAAAGMGGAAASGVTMTPIGEQIKTTVTDLIAEVDWLRVWTMVLGLILVTIALWGLVTEQGKPLLKTAASAVDNPAETLVDLVGA